MENLRGILFMILAMAGFALEDLFIKLLSSHVPVSQILIILGFSGTTVFLIIALLTHAPILHRDLLNRPVIVRTFCELFAALFFTSAIALTPLSSVASILMTTPLMMKLGAGGVWLASEHTVSIGCVGCWCQCAVRLQRSQAPSPEMCWAVPTMNLLQSVFDLNLVLWPSSCHPHYLRLPIVVKFVVLRVMPTVPKLLAAEVVAGLILTTARLHLPRSIPTQVRLQTLFLQSKTVGTQRCPAKRAGVISSYCVKFVRNSVDRNSSF